MADELSETHSLEKSTARWPLAAAACVLATPHINNIVSKLGRAHLELRQHGLRCVDIALLGGALRARAVWWWGWRS